MKYHAGCMIPCIATISCRSEGPLWGVWLLAQCHSANH